MLEGIRGIAGARRGLLGLVLGVVLVGSTGCAAGEGDGPAAAPTSVVSSAPTASPTAAPTAVPPAGPASSVPAGAFDEVLTLVLQRLSTGDAVAVSKLFSGQPVTDEAREKAVLDAAAARATEMGVDQDYVARVFTDQIAASKEVQQSLLDAWAAGVAATPTSAPDLATEVRPILDGITQSLVPALGAVERFRDDPGCGTAVAASTATATAGSIASPVARAALPTATARLCG